MSLNPQQRAALEAEAKRRGVDPAALIKEAESLVSAGSSGSDGAQTSSSPSGSQDQPKLYQYHLPFVRVREVRKIWLGLDEPFDGDDEIASDWSAKHGGSGGSPSGSSGAP